jgi:alkaline phosphatase
VLKSGLLRLQGSRNLCVGVQWKRNFLYLFMAKYVDGYVLSVPKKNQAAYRKMAREGAAIWKKLGALEYRECRADDVAGQPGCLSFPKLAKTKPDEEVWFSFVVFRSKKDRNRINKQVMEYFTKKYDEKQMASMPFDMKRMAMGGFTVEVEA